MRATTLLLLFFSSVTQASVEADVAYDRIAQHLELVRNQLELTATNQRTIGNDVRKQEREIAAWGVFERIPLARDDFKSDRELTRALRSQLERASGAGTAYAVRSVRLVAGWKVAPNRVPRAVNFDEGARIPEDQVADRRLVELVLRFPNEAPREPRDWFDEQRASVRRLLEPVSTRVRNRDLTVRAWIFRYRELDYPKMLAPDLSRYRLPGAPASESQKASARRIARYRAEIPRLWPQAQPHIDGIRAFALNDLRMNFFVKRASVQGH